MSAILLPPDLRARLRRLSLAPRGPAPALGFGMHAGRSRGGGIEFAQYRPYEPGDDLRQIDWRLLARSDHFFVREAERESQLALWIVLDASASMAQADRVDPAWSRLDAAKRLGAALIEIALKDGDRFGLLVLQESAAMMTRSGGGARHRDQMLAALARVPAAGRISWQRDFAQFGGRFAPGDLLIVLTDGFDDDCVAALERLARIGRDISLIQILTAEERDFPFSQSHAFEDPETGARVLGDGPAMRARFLERFGAARAGLAARLRAAGTRCAEHFIDESADLPIRALFAPTQSSSQSGRGISSK